MAACKAAKGRRVDASLRRSFWIYQFSEMFSAQKALRFLLALVTDCYL